MSCVLRIEGRAFRVDEFLKETSLKAYKIWHTGESIIPKSKENSHYQNSGCSIDISKADFDQFDIQKSDAMKFLKEKSELLKKFKEFGLLDSECSTLDFGIHTRMFDVEVQFDRFEPELLRLAGSLNIAIELSQYEP